MTKKDVILQSKYYSGSAIVLVYVGVPVQVAEEHLHGVLVWFGQLMDQFLHSVNFMFGFFDFCSKKLQKQCNIQAHQCCRVPHSVVENVKCLRCTVLFNKMVHVKHV